MKQPGLMLKSIGPSRGQYLGFSGENLTKRAYLKLAKNGFLVDALSERKLRKCCSVTCRLLDTKQHLVTPPLSRRESL